MTFDLKSHQQSLFPVIKNSNNNQATKDNNLNYSIGNHLQLKGIKKGKRRRKRIEISNGFSMQDKDSKAGLCKSVGNAPRDMMM